MWARMMLGDHCIQRRRSFLLYTIPIHTYTIIVQVNPHIKLASLVKESVYFVMQACPFYMSLRSPLSPPSSSHMYTIIDQVYNVYNQSPNHTQRIITHLIYNSRALNSVQTKYFPSFSMHSAGFNVIYFHFNSLGAVKKRKQINVCS